MLGKGRVDFPEVCKAIDDIVYKGWIQKEGALPPNSDMVASYLLNNEYIRSVFER